MPCYTDPYPSYRDEGEITRYKNRISDIEGELLAKADTVNWLTAALCLMTDSRLTSYANTDFEKYVSNITPEMWKESGIKKKDLIAWKKAHDAEDIKRRALEKLTPEERAVLGL